MPRFVQPPEHVVIQTLHRDGYLHEEGYLNTTLHYEISIRDPFQHAEDMEEDSLFAATYESGAQA